MNVAVPMAFFMYQGRQMQRAQLLYIGSVRSHSSCLVVASSSRGAFLGLLAVGAYCWFDSPRKVMSLIVGCALRGLILLQRRKNTGIE